MMSYNRCKDIPKFGNKYLPLVYKTQVEFRSYFSGKKVRLMVQEIRYITSAKIGSKIATEVLICASCISKGCKSIAGMSKLYCIGT